MFEKGSGTQEACQESWTQNQMRHLKENIIFHHTIGQTVHFYNELTWFKADFSHWQRFLAVCRNCEVVTHLWTRHKHLWLHFVAKSEARMSRLPSPPQWLAAVQVVRLALSAPADGTGGQTKPKIHFEKIFSQRWFLLFYIVLIALMYLQGFICLISLVSFC